MLETGLIELSHSAWSSPCLLIPKLELDNIKKMMTIQQCFQISLYISQHCIHHNFVHASKPVKCSLLYQSYVESLPQVKLLVVYWLSIEIDTFYTSMLALV